MDNGSRIYRYCEVKLPGSEKLHPYRSDRFELSVGDVVTVPVGATNDPVTGTVVSVRCCLQSDSPCPPGGERQVIRLGPAVVPAVTDPLPSSPQTEQEPADWAAVEGAGQGRWWSAVLAGREQARAARRPGPRPQLGSWDGAAPGEAALPRPR